MIEQVAAILEVANSTQIHWRYAIFAIRCLRTFVRRDLPLTSQQTQYFLRKTYDDHPTIVSSPSNTQMIER